jgi:PPOX class probable F420-dependent enzyme
MATNLSPEAKQLLDGPNFAHFATLMPDGSPLATPVWIGRDGDKLVICTSEGSLKAKNTRKDPRVGVSMVDFDNPYEELQIRGRVVEWRNDSDLKILDGISRKYTGNPFPMRDTEGRVAMIIAVDKERYMKLPFSHQPPKKV